MDVQFAPAIAALEQQLVERQRAVLDTKRSINLLLKMAGDNPRYTEDDVPSSGWVRPDQFYGKALTAAAAEYLAMRKQACQPAEIVRALEAGGFDFDVLPWKKDDRVRPFTISLSKNTGSETGKFHKLKNGSFGLKAWYEEDFLKKAAAAGDDAAASAKKKKKKKKKKRKAGKRGEKPDPPAPARAAKEKGAVKASTAVKPKAGPLKPQTKSRLSPEGLKRIANAQKARWAKFRNKGPKLLPGKTSRPAADQTTQKAVAS